MVGDAGRVVAVECRIEGDEPAGPRARRGGQPRAVTVGLVLWVLRRRGATARRAERSGVVCTMPLAMACST